MGHLGSAQGWLGSLVLRLHLGQQESLHIVSHPGGHDPDLVTWWQGSMIQDARPPEAQAWNGNDVNSATLNWPKQFPSSASRTKKYSPPLEGRCCTITLKRGMDAGRSILGPFLQKPTGCCVSEWQTKCHSVRNEASIVCIILDITYVTAVNILCSS